MLPLIQICILFLAVFSPFIFTHTFHYFSVLSPSFAQSVSHSSFHSHPQSFFNSFTHCFLSFISSHRLTCSAFHLLTHPHHHSFLHALTLRLTHPPPLPAHSYTHSLTVYPFPFNHTHPSSSHAPVNIHSLLVAYLCTPGEARMAYIQR